MFGTIIQDSYKQCEAHKLSDSIEEICSPMDGYGWSSAGIYSFWDYKTEEIFYIGLAIDLGERFKQHNGIISVSDKSSKKNLIDDYFLSSERLGYTIFVQSAISQPITHRNKKILIGGIHVDEVRTNIRRIEGQLIEAYKVANGEIPEWNKVGGDVRGGDFATVGNYHQIIRNFTKSNKNSILVARKSIAEIADNPTFERYENQLHIIRMYMLNHGLTYREAVSFAGWNQFFNFCMNEMKQNHYL